MKNIHVLPTYKPSRVWTDLNGNFYLHPIPTTLFFMQNIYITSDEEIKKGDWYLYGNEILKTDKLGIFDPTLVSICKKIILTTDQDLIKDGIQSIDDEFLEWFVKNPSCEEVEVQKEQINNKPGSSYGTITIYKYKIITPKEELSPFDLKESPITDNEFYQSLEEPKQDEHYLDSYGCTKNEFELSLNFKKEERKQEMPIINGSYGCIIETNKQETTLEEAAENKYTKGVYIVNGIDIADAAREAFIEGAKEQAKRMYNEEEVKEIVYYMVGHLAYITNITFNGTIMDELFEQFKKK